MTRGPRRWPPIDGWARNTRKNAIAVGGMVAAAQSVSHSMSGLAVAAAKKPHRCHAATVKENAANEV